MDLLEPHIGSCLQQSCKVDNLDIRSLYRLLLTAWSHNEEDNRGRIEGIGRGKGLIKSGIISLYLIK